MNEQLPPTLRIPFVRRCRLSRAEGDVDAMLLDLSLRGVYVASDAAAAVGEQLDIVFTVPGNVLELTLPGVVAWAQTEQTHPVHGLPPGFGVRFRTLTADEVRLIARTIHHYCESNPIYRQYL